MMTDMNWTFEAVPLTRNEIHNKVIEMLNKEPRKKGLDVSTGIGSFGDRVRKAGFVVSGCDINPLLFSHPRFKNRDWRSESTSKGEK
jgi:2-polyprenyl-3-methyl-5-hydroxy-6-metoxy-1,4-benzoquinol methylase